LTVVALLLPMQDVMCSRDHNANIRNPKQFLIFFVAHQPEISGKLFGKTKQVLKRKRLLERK
jgi:hypothetical protein